VLSATRSHPNAFSPARSLVTVSSIGKRRIRSQANENARYGLFRPRLKMLQVDSARRIGTVSFIHPLEELPEEEVYKILIDTYRLRLDDNYVSAAEFRGLYAGEDPVTDFNRFLDKAEWNGEILPKWWNKEKRKRCIEIGTKKDGWSYLGHAIEKQDVIDEYKDRYMPGTLRMLAEQVYGPLLFY
jgi:splicing suppressor protein 51